jgi:hypothetical protein
MNKAIKKTILGTVLGLTALTAVITNAEPAPSQNIEILQETFGITNITRRTDIRRSGIYHLTFEGSRIPTTPLPLNFEIFDYDVEDDMATLSLMYTPLTISINWNNDRNTEAVRLTTLHTRGQLTDRQFEYLINQLHNRENVVPPSIIEIVEQLEVEQETDEESSLAITVLEEERTEIITSPLPPSRQEYDQRHNEAIDFRNKSDWEFQVWLDNLASLDFVNMSDEAFYAWMGTINLVSLTDTRWTMLIDKISELENQ